MEGIYLYCIAEGATPVSLGITGIEGREIYSVPFKDICAVVHNSPAIACMPENQNKTASSVAIHQQVVEAVWSGSRTVVPMIFGTIIEGQPGGLNEWLSENYERLRQNIERLRDKEEFDVQVFWNADIIAERLIDTILELKSLKLETEVSHGGAAYMHRQLFEKKLMQEMESEARLRFRELYYRIKERVEELKIAAVRETSSVPERLMSCSCLVFIGTHMDLFEELDRINKIDNIFIRLAGPLPPYSFTDLGPIMMFKEQ